jgi:hypothetical protein
MAVCTGGFLTFARLAWATITGLVVTVGFALLDLTRSTSDHGSLGRFLTQAQNGTGGTAIHRAGAANTVAVLTSPLTVLVVGAGVLLLFVLLRPWGGLKRLFGIYPAVRAALVGTAVAGLLAGFLDGAGFVVAGAVAATAVPVACLAALRVLGHANDRTAAGRPVPPAGDEDTAASAAEVTSDTPVRVPSPATPAPSGHPDPPTAVSPPAAATGDVLP